MKVNLKVMKSLFIVVLGVSVVVLGMRPPPSKVLSMDGSTNGNTKNPTLDELTSLIASLTKQMDAASSSLVENYIQLEYSYLVEKQREDEFFIGIRGQKLKEKGRVEVRVREVTQNVSMRERVKRMIDMILGSSLETMNAKTRDRATDMHFRATCLLVMEIGPLEAMEGQVIKAYIVWMIAWKSHGDEGQLMEATQCGWKIKEMKAIDGSHTIWLDVQTWQNLRLICGSNETCAVGETTIRRSERRS
ncbi:hypothetical protein RND71_005662 [Anisodus tanguticus]|uniref:Uncharacterized protein n=1 Tax=Anisodus tanguticus TaxID=243964 RepID=A0AAE1SRX5_9SOLA|nr:hypothetical protein RND71_005662 [Anisodus tanguticus]